MSANRETQLRCRVEEGAVCLASLRPSPRAGAAAARKVQEGQDLRDRPTETAARAQSIRGVIQRQALMELPRVREEGGDTGAVVRDTAMDNLEALAGAAGTSAAVSRTAQLRHMLVHRAPLPAEPTRTTWSLQTATSRAWAWVGCLVNHRVQGMVVTGWW